MGQPGLFGINNSNRNFSSPQGWGKNQFNSSFPMALCCYMGHKEIKPVYLVVDQKCKIQHQYISVDTLFNISPASRDIWFEFESSFSQYHPYVNVGLVAADVVIKNITDKSDLRCFEIKLTALPDNTTCDLPDTGYSCELVIRPGTISYIALELIKFIVSHNKIQEIRTLLSPTCSLIKNWVDSTHVLSHLNDLRQTVLNLIDFLVNQLKKDEIYHQQPFLIQPVWKTIGKSSHLHENCLDVFVWSGLALMLVPLSQIRISDSIHKISRPARTIIWLIKMLYDFVSHGVVNVSAITGTLIYDSRNDKAFAASGRVTYPFLSSPELTQPRIKKSDIKNIILHGGQNLLSPERRFDAIIVNTPGLFI